MLQWALLRRCDLRTELKETRMNCRGILGRAFQAQGSGRSGSDGGSEKSSDSECTLRVTPAGFTDDGLDVGFEENESKMIP